HVSTTANRIVISRSPAVPITASSLYRLDNIRNPDVSGSYYVRIQTFSSDDGTGTVLDEGGMVFAITRAVSVTAEVPPFLMFCTGVTIVNFNCNSATSFLIDM